MTLPYCPLPAPPEGVFVGAVGINDSGAVVGGASDGTGFILSGPTYQFIRQPGWLGSEARAIGNTGLVTGSSSNGDPTAVGGSAGFIYDPAIPAFTSIDVIPGTDAVFFIAQGINAAGQVVGSFKVFGDPHPTAFLRQPDGTFVTFRVNSLPTRARGINDAGLITGSVDTATGTEAFVGNSIGFELLQCPGDACPGVTDTAAEGINNYGQIVGQWTDTTGGIHGFIATPASLPTGTTNGGAYIFNVEVVPNVTIFIDPAVSLGFEYKIGGGGPKFASVLLPIGIGDSLYTLIVHGKSFAVAGGELFDFAAHGFAKGVDKFRVVAIEANAGLDPNNATAFPTGLTFTEAGTFTGTMTPLCAKEQKGPKPPKESKLTKKCID